MGELSCSSQPTAPTCVVWNLHLKDSPWQERVFIHGFSRSLTDGYAMLMSPSKGKTAVHGCHCLRDMAVQMREVMAMGWCMRAPCFNLLVTHLIQTLTFSCTEPKFISYYNVSCKVHIPTVYITPNLSKSRIKIENL